jgi:riboflavin synthase
VFTGIVRERGRVLVADGDGRAVRLELDAPTTAADAAVGDSISIAGCCLTVVAVDGPRLAFDAVPETLSRTTLGDLEPGHSVNLEPALRAGDPLGGHYVQGHVDGVGRVRSADQDDEETRVWIEASDELLRYCVEKGSITVDGVSLTVAEVTPEAFAVALIPHTLQVTTLSDLAPGDSVNLEVDVLAKYVERLVAPQS